MAVALADEIGRRGFRATLATCLTHLVSQPNLQYFNGALDV